MDGAPRDRRRSRSRDRYERPRDDRPRRRDSRSRSPRRRHSRSSPRRQRSRSRSRRRDDKDRDKDREPREKARGRLDSRSRSRSRERRRDKDRARSRSASRSSSASSSGSDRRRHKRKKDKHGKRRRSRSGERRERKREKKDKKKRKSLAVSHQWGKYGLINESDLYNKEQEFRAWLVEERKINPETIAKEQTKKEFAKFVEDYNTATLPHDKFYNMEAYERRMNAMRSGEYLPPTDDRYDPTADMRAHASSHKKVKAEPETYMSKEQLMELRKVQNERIQAGKMKLLGMEIKQNLGVRMDGTMFDD